MKHIINTDNIQFIRIQGDQADIHFSDSYVSMTGDDDTGDYIFIGTHAKTLSNILKD